MQKVEAKIKIKFLFLFDQLHGPSQMHKLLILVKVYILSTKSNLIAPNVFLVLIHSYSGAITHSNKCMQLRKSHHKMAFHIPYVMPPNSFIKRTLSVGKGQIRGPSITFVLVANPMSRLMPPKR